MAANLPEIYFPFVANLNPLLEDARQRQEEIYFVRYIAIIQKQTAEGLFFCGGSYQESALQAIKETLAKRGGKKFRFPKKWEKQMLLSDKKCFLNTSGIRIYLGAYNFKKLAQIAEGSWLSFQRIDENGNEILSREEFLRSFRGGYVDYLFNNNRSCRPTRMIQPPDEKGIEHILEEAGELYDRYLAIPYGSTLFTRDAGLRGFLGKKKYQNFRWTRKSKCIYSKKEGPTFTTADPCIGVFNYLEGKKPIICISFKEQMRISGTTQVIPKGDEQTLIKSFFNGEKIEVRISKNISLPGINLDEKGKCYPTEEQIMEAVNARLEIT